MEQPTTPSLIETWAIVEIMGHVKLAGHIRTEAFGAVCMLRVDVPELPEKRTKGQTHYSEDGRWLDTPVDSEQIQPAEPAYTRYFGLQAVFSLTPCDEATARGALESMRRMPAKLLRLTGALPAPTVDPRDDGPGEYLNSDELDELEADDLDDDGGDS